MDSGRRSVDVGRAGPAEGRAGAPDWQGLEASAEFQRLIKARRTFIIPAVVFFLVYYFALPLSNGLLPDLMKTTVIGKINLAYLFALSEFVMAWVLAYLYISRATKLFDPLAEAVRRLAGRARGV